MPRVPVLILSFLFAMCASAKQYTADQLPPERLTFRWGGGFTGETKEYVVLPNGQVFFRRSVLSDLPLREHTPLERKEARELFATYEAQEFAQLGYDNPGNMTYTVGHHSESDSTGLTWGGSEVQPSEAVRTYWRRATGLLADTEPIAEVSE